MRMPLWFKSNCVIQVLSISGSVFHGSTVAIKVMHAPISGSLAAAGLGGLQNKMRGLVAAPLVPKVTPWRAVQSLAVPMRVGDSRSPNDTLTLLSTRNSSPEKRRL
ncbi:hypothetical protein GALL_13320 [mine drainage metagenome]|uniref:Uncharacterized protein n=1 Tax=mine drainage metagenome TaxID=410659 RepID=A0A1J5TFV9_9ZZZZ